MFLRWHGNQKNFLPPLLRRWECFVEIHSGSEATDQGEHWHQWILKTQNIKCSCYEHEVIYFEPLYEAGRLRQNLPPSVRLIGLGAPPPSPALPPSPPVSNQNLIGSPSHGRGGVPPGQRQRHLLPKYQKSQLLARQSLGSSKLKIFNWQTARVVVEREQAKVGKGGC